MTPFERLKVVSQLGQAVLFLHTPQPKDRDSIAHGDINPRNVFLHREGKQILAYLGDFGGALELTKKELDQISRHQKLIPMTPGYFTYTDFCNISKALTHVEKKAAYLALDVFGFCSTSWEILTGEPSYTKWMRDTDFIITNNLNNQQGFIKSYGTKLFEIFKKGLSEHPVKRPDLKAIIDEINVYRSCFNF